MSVPKPYQFLTSQLQPPPDFLNVSSVSRPGWYIFGHDNFRVSDVHVAGILHRSIAGRHEEFILGVLSVLLIALFSEILHTVLMRTTKGRRVSRLGLQTAFVLDEVHHFRNVWRLFKTGFSRRSNPRARTIALTSCFMVSLGLLLLGAEVLAVFLTQEVTVYSTRFQVNLMGFQPAGTTKPIASRVHRVTLRNTCVSPTMPESNETREYALKACVESHYQTAMDTPADIATYIDVRSWFHVSGSDHEVIFGNRTVTGLHALQTRATIEHRNGSMSRGILFQNNATTLLSHTRYLQKFMVYSALEWSCNQEFETAKCKDLAKKIVMGKSVLIRKNIVRWTLQDDEKETEEDIKIMVSGWQTRFDLELRMPFSAVQDALRVFATSGVIREVEGKGYYARMKDEVPEFGIEHLVSEKGRNAGVFLLGIIFIVLLLVLLLMRVCFKPVSLAQLARDSVTDDEAEIEEEFVGAGTPRWKEGKPKETGSDEYQSDEYHSYLSTVTLDGIV